MHGYFWVISVETCEQKGEAAVFYHQENISAGSRKTVCFSTSILGTWGGQGMTLHSSMHASAFLPVHQSSRKILTIWNSKWGYNFLLFSLSLFREIVVNYFFRPTGLQLLFFVILGFLFTLQLYFCGLWVLRKVLCVTGYDKNDISYFIYPGFYSDFLGLL